VNALIPKLEIQTVITATAAFAFKDKKFQVMIAHSEL